MLGMMDTLSLGTYGKKIESTQSLGNSFKRKRELCICRRHARVLS